MLNFYVELCEQIKSHVNFKDSLLNNLICLNPSVATSGKVTSIVPLYQSFQKILKLDMEKLDLEWRDLSNDDEILEIFKRKYLSIRTSDVAAAQETVNVPAHGEEEWEDIKSDDEVAYNEDIVDELDPAKFWVFLETVKDTNGRS